MNYENKSKEELIELIKFYKYDKLTGMKQRKDFDIEFIERFYKGEEFYLIMFDVNDLHSVNRAKDGGWAVGDALIRRVSERIKYYCTADSYRYGGDEFMVMVGYKPDFNGAIFPESCYELVSSKGFDEPAKMLEQLDKMLTKVKDAYHKGHNRRVPPSDRRS